MQSLEPTGVARLNSKGLEIIGTEPDCICDGGTITLWDCECKECTTLQKEEQEQWDDEN